MSSVRSTFNSTLFSDSAVQYDSSRESIAIRMSGLDIYSILAAWTTSAAPAAKTWDAAVKASLSISDLTYTADTAGVSGNSITIEYKDSVKASKVIQDLTYTADAKGSAGNNIQITYVTGGFGGQESAALTGSGTGGDPYVITATIQDPGVYTAKTGVGGTRGTKVIQDLTYTANIRGEYVTIDYATGGFGGQEASTRTGSGTVGDPYVVTTTIQGDGDYTAAAGAGGVAAALVVQDLTYTADARGVAGNYIQIDYNGGGTAGAEVVSLAGSGTAGDPYIISVQIESGVSTAAQIKTAIDLVGAVTALIDCSISGVGGNAQTTTVATALVGGVDSIISVGGDTITIAGHGFIDGVRVQVASTGTLPDPLVAATDYWVVGVAGSVFQLSATYGGGAINLTDQGASGATITFTPSPTTATEIDAAVAADADSNTTVAVAVTGTGTNPQTQISATPLVGNVASFIQTSDEITIVGHGFVNGVRVRVSSTGTLPSPLAAGTDYWVIGVAGSVFKLSATYGGGAVNITDQGTESATVTITPSDTTAAEIKTAIDADGPSAAVVDIVVSGTGTDVQTLVVNEALTGGLGGVAGTEQVVVAGTDIVVYIEDGVSSSDQVKAAVNAAAAATALVDVSGSGATAQAVTAADSLAGGTGSELVAGLITIPSHGFVTGIVGQLTTTGTLPTGLAVLTNYWVIKVSDNTIKLASSYDNAIAGTFITPSNDGAAGSVNTFTPTALGGSLQLQVTNDDPALSSASWVNFGSPTAISGDSSVALVGPTGTSLPIAFPYRGLKLVAAVTGGGIALTAKFHARSIG